MKDSSGKVFVGIRRTSRSCDRATLNVEVEEKHGRFSRMPQETVDAAMRVPWTVGMRVRMSLETEDSARMNWFNGSVTKVTINDAGLWRRSPWGMLQVLSLIDPLICESIDTKLYKKQFVVITDMFIGVITWDDPEVLQKVRDVSPWQVECFIAGPQGETPRSIRNILDEQERSLLPDDKEDSILTGFKSRIIDSLSPSVSDSSLFPVGMQGARHDIFHTAGLFDSKSNGNQTFLNSVHGVNAPERSDVPVELSIWIPSQSGGSSPARQGSSQALDRETLEPASNQVTKASIQLFGQVIHVENHIDKDKDN
ncbi:auxin response factor [Musa troglodytarum]|uniref:Auxin response factor n=1 Tax=Musa troglodytarum TaxID=320322 RepID=A0A9E7L6M4_9LILI|nr:auxin response factor [Musa troglodytarum]